MSWRDARQRAAQLLDQVRMSDVPRRLRQYPHELSGGMRQRAMIAMALACDPKLLIADEPTTALDVSVQAQILALLRELMRERSMALALVTHDMGVIAALADDVLVMRAGSVVERGAAPRSSRAAPARIHARAAGRDAAHGSGATGAAARADAGAHIALVDARSRRALPHCATDWLRPARDLRRRG